MSAPLATPVHAHVAFVSVPGFDALAVSDQVAAKERLENAILTALGRIAAADRIVLDAPDGMALVYFGEAELALDLAQALHRDAGAHVGLNYGPLAISSRSGDTRVFGDGLAGAEAAARFSDGANVLLTETFAAALSATAPERARELAGAGDFTDTRVRIHKFYAPDPALRTARMRRMTLYAIFGAVLILLIGVIGRDIYQPLFQSRPAIVKLEVRPRAEVFVDGVSQGRTPPLTEIRVAPGKHTVGFRQAGFRPLEVPLEVKPGERRTLAHALQRVPDAPPKPDFWRDLKKKFGS
jgi:hypothetical protein